MRRIGAIGLACYLLLLGSCGDQASPNAGPSDAGLVADAAPADAAPADASPPPACSAQLSSHVWLPSGGSVRIEVPALDCWNHAAVVIVAGQTYPQVDQEIFTSGELQDALLSAGYLVATIDFATPPYDLSGTMVAMSEVPDAIAGVTASVPDVVLALGFSTRTPALLHMAEDAASPFDGSLVACGMVQGVQDYIDELLGFNIQLQVAGLYFPGVPVNVPGPFTPAQVDALLSPSLSDSTKKNLFEYVRLASHLQSDEFYSGRKTLNEFLLLSTNYLFGIRQYTGAIPGRENVVYTLTSQEITYLNDLGVNANDLLTQANNLTNYTTFNPIEPAVDFKAPVLTVHNTNDWHIRSSEHSLLNARAQQAGSQSFLLQVFVDGFGHCDFEPSELLFALDALREWALSGTRPSVADFGVDDGFTPDFVPAPSMHPEAQGSTYIP